MKSKQVLAIRNATLESFYLAEHFSFVSYLQEERTQSPSSQDRLEKIAHARTHRRIKVAGKTENCATSLQIQLRSTNLSSSVVHYDDVVQIDLKFNIRVYVKKTSQIQIYRKPLSCK